MKSELRDGAITLRKQGLSYSEILKQIPVAKSTLSLWLHSVGLSKKQKQRLTAKKLEAMRRGSQAKHNQRLALTERIKKEAMQDVKNLNSKDLWLIGVALYWAEGTKEKENAVGSGITFNNSDSRMIKVFLKWLTDIIKIPLDDIKFEIYIHKTADYKKALRYWAKILGCEMSNFKVYFKKHNIRTNRKNTGENYNGLLRISVKRSSWLNRKIAGWIEGLANYWNK